MEPDVNSAWKQNLQSLFMRALTVNGDGTVDVRIGSAVSVIVSGMTLLEINKVASTDNTDTNAALLHIDSEQRLVFSESIKNEIINASDVVESYTYNPDATVNFITYHSATVRAASTAKEQYTWATVSGNSVVSGVTTSLI